MIPAPMNRTTRPLSQVSQVGIFTPYPLVIHNLKSPHRSSDSF